MTKETETETTPGDNHGWTTLYVSDKVIPPGLPIARLTSHLLPDEFPRSTVRDSDRASNKEDQSR